MESANGEAKFWLDPDLELVRNYKLDEHDLSRIKSIIREHEMEIRNAWNRHFGS